MPINTNSNYNEGKGKSKKVPALVVGAGLVMGSQAHADLNIEEKRTYSPVSQDVPTQVLESGEQESELATTANNTAQEVHQVFDYPTSKNEATTDFKGSSNSAAVVVENGNISGSVGGEYDSDLGAIAKVEATYENNDDGVKVTLRGGDDYVSGIATGVKNSEENGTSVAATLGYAQESQYGKDVDQVFVAGKFQQRIDEDTSMYIEANTIQGSDVELNSTTTKETIDEGNKTRHRETITTNTWQGADITEAKLGVAQVLNDNRTMINGATSYTQNNGADAYGLDAGVSHISESGKTKFDADLSVDRYENRTDWDAGAKVSRIIGNGIEGYVQGRYGEIDKQEDYFVGAGITITHGGKNHYPKFSNSYAPIPVEHLQGATSAMLNNRGQLVTDTQVKEWVESKVEIVNAQASLSVEQIGQTTSSATLKIQASDADTLIALTITDRETNNVIKTIDLSNRTDFEKNVTVSGLPTDMKKDYIATLTSKNPETGTVETTTKTITITTANEVVAPSDIETVKQSDIKIQSVTTDSVSVIPAVYLDADGVKPSVFHLLDDQGNIIATNNTGVFAGLEKGTSYSIEQITETKNGATGKYENQKTSIDFTTKTPVIIDQAPEGVTLAPITLYQGETLILPTVELNDKEDGKVAVVFDTSSFNSAQLGEQTITGTATDSAGNTTEVTQKINVIAKNQIKITLSNDTISETAKVGDVVGVLDCSATDCSYEIVGTDDTFIINDKNEVVLAKTLDYSTKNSYELTIIAKTDDVKYINTKSPLTINVTEKPNIAPSDILISSNTVGENLPAGTVVGVLSCVDPDSANTCTYISAGGDGKFAIVDGKIVTTQQLDFESSQSYTLYVTATDPKGAVYSEQITITVMDEQAPSVGAVNITKPTYDSVIISVANPTADAYRLLIPSLNIDDTNATGTGTFSVVTIPAGTYTGQISAIDNNEGEGAPEPISFEVVAPNIAPRITAINGDTTVDVGENVDLEILVEDDENNIVSIELVGNEIPAGLQIMSNRIVGSVAQAGTYNFGVKVTDDKGLSDVRDLSLNVTETPISQPTITIADQTINDNGGFLSTTITPTYTDIQPGASFSLINHPFGDRISIDDLGTITWFGDLSANVTRNITIQIVNPDGGTTQTTFSLTVINNG